ncbi:MAG: hypothetical protein DI537_55985, partial [Stutzerimonas stutzeri]
TLDEIGTPGSRYRINTPALVLDLDRLDRNLAVMAEAMATAGKLLRPHVKSHKCSQIARMQCDHGAIGICCATLDEAEVMAAQGLRGILITSPITTPQKIARLMALIAQDDMTMIVVDNPRNLAALSDAADRASLVVRILIDLELGFGRTGVTSAEAAVTLGRTAQVMRAVHIAGLQAYGGHLQHIADPIERTAATTAAGRAINRTAMQLRDAGVDLAILSGGGTGTHAIDNEGDWFTEIQAGSYPLMDADYGAVGYTEDRPWPFAASLFVQASVISCNIPGTVTVDSGTKAIATNGPPPQVVTPGLTGATFEFTGDEHGRIRLAPENPALDIGDRIEMIVSHCDPTVAMHDVYHCVRGDRLVDLWRIDARGRL